MILCIMVPQAPVHGISQARILEWAAMAFFRRSSQLRDQTKVSCTARQFLYHWTTREALPLSFVQSLSHVWLCNPIDCSMPGFPVLHHLVELAQTHVHQVDDAIQPSHILCCPLLLPSAIFPSIRVFSNESVLSIRCPKYWSFNFNISPSNEYFNEYSSVYYIYMSNTLLTRVYKNTILSPVS